MFSTAALPLTDSPIRAVNEPDSEYLAASDDCERQLVDANKELERLRAALERCEEDRSRLLGIVETLSKRH